VMRDLEADSIARQIFRQSRVSPIWPKQATAQAHAVF